MPTDRIELERRLEDWGAYWRSGGRADRAESLEGNFRTNDRSYLRPVASTQRSIDVSDAFVIEGAVCALELFYHVLLKSWYIRRNLPEDCVLIGLKAANLARPRRINFDLDMDMGKALLAAELERPAVVRKMRASEYVREVLGLPALTFQNLMPYSTPQI